MVLKKLIFNSFFNWEGVVVLKELIFNKLILWEGVVILKELILAVSTLRGCGGLENN